MLGFRSRFERGDTLIEVLFAVAVFSFVVVGSLAVMNQGTAAAQRSLDITVVRQEIDSQAETLRFLHDSYTAVYQSGLTFNTADATTSPAEEWYEMVNSGLSSSSVSALNGMTDCPSSPPVNSFIMDSRNAQFVDNVAKLVPATTYAQLKYPVGGGPLDTSEGIWIEAIRAAPDANGIGYVDFHIRACWEGPGLDVPLTLGTIVRLYEPRG